MRSKASIAGAAITTLAMMGGLTACAEESASGDESGGAGVEHGASLEEFQEAFADVSPVEINWQSPAAKGSPVDDTYQTYIDYVEEYSDGKITFNVAYSNAIAGATEIDDAIRDGRLDLGNILPVYEPDQYPANAALANTSFVGTQAPAVAPLEVHAAHNAAALEVPQVTEELEAAGMHVLLPWYSGDSNGILCSSPASTKEELEGLQVVAAGEVNAAELKAAGATPVSMDYTELFESLQRGAVDCSLNSMRVTSLMGLAPVADDFTIDEEIGLAKTPGALAINKDLWDSLPLVAQQVLHDGTEILLQANIEGSTQFQVDGLKELVDNGGSVNSFDDATREAIAAAHDEALADVASNDKIEDGQALVDAVVSAAEQWTPVIEELGFPADVTFADFAQWHADNGYDLAEYAAKVYEELLLPGRPS